MSINSYFRINNARNYAREKKRERERERGEESRNEEPIISGVHSACQHIFIMFEHLFNAILIGFFALKLVCVHVHMHESGS